MSIETPCASRAKWKKLKEKMFWIKFCGPETGNSCFPWERCLHYGTIGHNLLSNIYIKYLRCWQKLRIPRRAAANGNRKSEASGQAAYAALQRAQLIVKNGTNGQKQQQHEPHIYICCVSIFFFKFATCELFVNTKAAINFSLDCLKRLARMEQWDLTQVISYDTLFMVTGYLCFE